MITFLIITIIVLYICGAFFYYEAIQIFGKVEKTDYFFVFTWFIWAILGIFETMINKFIR